MGSVSENIDRRFFSWFGGTLFSSPGQITLKEIHLAGGSLLGKDVIVEGTLVDRSRNDTYVVIADESARMLVVLSELAAQSDHWDSDLAFSKERPIRIHGSVQSGKKGLPFIMAKSITSGSAPKKG